MVFCRVKGWKEDEEAVEAREGVCNMMDILGRMLPEGGGWARISKAARP